MRIVMVDPSRVMLKILARMLAAADYDVSTYVDASEALERVRRDTSVDVLVTSLEPHGMMGLDLCRAVRRIVRRRTVHILVMSSTAERRTLIEALDSGADDFIGKPPAPEELLARLRVAARVTAMHRDLVRLATIDGLTGAFNRRAFFEAALALDRAPPAPGAAVALFDIDRFKRINDSYGHAAGDRVLAGVAEAAHAATATLGRIGGEEFALLFEHATAHDSIAACEALRIRISELTFNSIDPALTVTCSFGAGAWGEDEIVDDALKRCDIALYAAKTGGRNRVVAAAGRSGPCADRAPETDCQAPTRHPRRMAEAAE